MGDVALDAAHAGLAKMDSVEVDHLHDAIAHSGADLARWMGWWNDEFTIDEVPLWFYEDELEHFEQPR